MMPWNRYLRNAAWAIAIAVVVVLALAPVAWMISTSLKPESQIVTAEIRWIPETITFENFQTVLERYPMWKWGLNSLVVATAATVLVTFLTSLAGYAFARLEFKGRDAIFLIIISMSQKVLLMKLNILMQLLIKDQKILGLKKRIQQKEIEDGLLLICLMKITQLQSLG